jgi:predicted Fe-Mo cluster-binding NifX family protein
MRVAVASEDGTGVSSHFGRSACFLIFEIEGGKVVGREVRDNEFTAHAKGECKGETHHDHPLHSHASIVEALRDCEAVICYGMGARAAEALSRQGIHVYILSERCTPEAAVGLFVEGKLGAPGQNLCRCHE